MFLGSTRKHLLHAHGFGACDRGQLLFILQGDHIVSANECQAIASLFAYHDCELVDLSVVGVQSLVGFGVVLVDAGFDGEEGVLLGLDVGESAPVLGLDGTQTTQRNDCGALYISSGGKYNYLESEPVLVIGQGRSLHGQNGRQYAEQGQCDLHGDACKPVALCRSLSSSHYLYPV